VLELTVMKRKETSTKSRGLFDHVKHIREIQDPNYYDSLSEDERKSFNKFMLLRALSMDSTVVEDMSYVSKYFSIIPEKQFYQPLITLIPKSRKFSLWIKSKKQKVNQTLLNLLSKYYEVGSSEAEDYCTILLKDEKGLSAIVNICKLFGKTDQEIEKLLEVK